jgi:hypothetical protein
MTRVQVALHRGVGLLAMGIGLGGCPAAETSDVNPGPPPPFSVSITPSAPTTDACGTVTFQATVHGTTNQGVTWSVQEGASGGTITGAGVYTAPTTASTYHVVAASQANTLSTASVPVVVGAERVLSLSVNPSVTSVAPSASRQFAASITTTCGTFP